MNALAQPFLTSIDSVEAWLAFRCLGDHSGTSEYGPLTLWRTIRPKKVMKRP